MYKTIDVSLLLRIINPLESPIINQSLSFVYQFGWQSPQLLNKKNVNSLLGEP